MLFWCCEKGCSIMCHELEQSERTMSNKKCGHYQTCPICSTSKWVQRLLSVRTRLKNEHVLPEYNSIWKVTFYGGKCRTHLNEVNFLLLDTFSRKEFERVIAIYHKMDPIWQNWYVLGIGYVWEDSHFSEFTYMCLRLHFWNLGKSKN